MKTVKDNNTYKAIPSTISTLVLPNYSVVGSPTISSDHIASGFSLNNYIKITQSLDIAAQDELEMYFKIYGYSTSHANPIFSNERDGTYASKFYILTDGKSKLQLSENFSSWAINYSYNNVIPNNEWLIVRIRRHYNTSASTYSWSVRIRKTDGTNVVSSSGTTSNIFTQNLNRIGMCNDSTSNVKTGFGGMIDLKECYYVVNGQEVWRGVKEITQQAYKGVNL